MLLVRRWSCLPTGKYGQGTQSAVDKGIEYVLCSFLMLTISQTFYTLLIMSFHIYLVSKPAPAFEATAVINGSFKSLKLSDYLGKYVVFFFYPLDL